MIGVAASAGGVEALRHVVGDLPGDLPAAVCVVLHIPATGRSLLAPILDRAGELSATVAEHGGRIEPGVVYVAPADHHLLVRRETLELNRGPKENGVRPAADPLLRSLAHAWGAAAIGVVLSGARDDGAAGVAAVAAGGGTVVVQDPDDAVVPGMPESAIAATTPDHVVRLAEMGALLTSLVGAGPPRERGLAPEPDAREPRPAGPPSAFSCPECGGPLWDLHDGPLVRYRCRVGHTYSQHAMVDAQAEAVEAALWRALELLEARDELLGRIGAERATRARRDVADRASLLRRAISLGVEPE